jgi:6-methylsalicylate decarboxylase
MDDAHVDLQMLSIGSMQVYLSDASRAAQAARLTNDMHDSLVQRYPGRFRLFGCLPLPHVDASLAELSRCLDELQCPGINLGCSADGRPLDDPLFDPVWAELDRRGAVVFLHPGVKIDGVVGCLDHHLAPDFVSPAEIGVTIMRLIIAGHTDRYRNVKLIVATTGGALPFLAERYAHGLRQSSPGVFDRLGGVDRHLRALYYDTSVIEEDHVLQLAKERFGADRLVLGSDYGRPTVTSQMAVDYIAESSYLTGAEKTAVLDHTAAELLGLGGSTPVPAASSGQAKAAHDEC